MAPIRQISHRQLEILVAFAERNPAAALNKKSSGPLGHQQVNKAWEDCARLLNAVGDGTIKTTDKWKRYWHMYKCRTKTKAADNRRNREGTGGGPNKLCPLTDLEERVVAVIGKVAVEGAPVTIPVNLYDDGACHIQLEPPQELEEEVISCPLIWEPELLLEQPLQATTSGSTTSATATTSVAATTSDSTTSVATTTSAATTSVVTTTSDSTTSVATTTSAATTSVVTTTSDSTTSVATTTSAATTSVVTTTSDSTTSVATTTSAATTSVAATTSDSTTSVATTTSAATTSVVTTTSDSTTSVATTTSAATTSVVTTTSDSTTSVATTTSAATTSVVTTTSDSTTSVATTTSAATTSVVTTSVAPNTDFQLPRSRNARGANHDDNVPRWAYNLEERRIAVEEQMAEAVAGISRSVAEIAAAQTRSAAAQEQCVELLLHLTQQFKNRNT